VTESVSVITSDGASSNLDQLVARGVQGVTGMMKVPAKRGTNLVIPGSHGEMHVAGKRSGPATLVLPLWVRGVTQDGRIPGLSDEGARLQFHDNLRELVALFTVDEQIRLRHTLTDGSARQIVGEVTDVIEPDITGYGRNTLGQLSIGLNCADPFWSDVEDLEVELSTAESGPLEAFAGATAPMEDLRIVIGPSLNPRFEQPSTGIWMKYGGEIGPGQTLVVDTSNDPDTGWSLTGTGGLEVDYAQLSYGEPGTRTTSRWFALKPEPGGPVVEFAHTGLAAASATLTGRRKYKIA
jgi:hypothetical protein